MHFCSEHHTHHPPHRSVSVASIMLSHLSWREDHLTCALPRTKSDQCGESTFPRSMFANPLDPVICPILALGVCILSRPYRPDGVHPALFEGTDQEDRYGKILSSVLQNLPESLLSSLGAKRTEIGTHSARKGAPTFALSMPGGPSPVSVFLRAGWSLGNVKDRYIFEGEGSDQVRLSSSVAIIHCINFQYILFSYAAAWCVACPSPIIRSQRFLRTSVQSLSRIWTLTPGTSSFRDTRDTPRHFGK